MELHAVMDDKNIQSVSPAASVNAKLQLAQRTHS